MLCKLHLQYLCEGSDPFDAIVIEVQKQGLCHAHILIMGSGDKSETVQGFVQRFLILL